MNLPRVIPQLNNRTGIKTHATLVLALGFNYKAITVFVGVPGPNALFRLLWTS